MDKKAGLVPGPLKVLLNRVLRSKASPLSDYFANIARKGMEAGFDRRTETMLPSTGAMALATLGPSTGILDHVVGTHIGQELRHATDKARQRLGATHPWVDSVLERYDPKFQDIVNLFNPVAGAVRPIPISKRNYRRLKRLISSEFSNPVARAAWQSQNPLVEAAIDHHINQATTISAPLLRNMARAIQGPAPSPLAERVARATIKPVAPHHNAETFLATAGVPAAVSVFTGAMNPLGAMTSMALPLAEAALLRKAEQGRTGSLTAVKMRMISNMADPKPGVVPFLERAGQRIWSAFDPNVDEFSRVGADINKVRRTALSAANALAPGYAAKARSLIGRSAGVLSEPGSMAGLGRNLLHDFAPEIQAAKSVAKGTVAAPGVAARAVGAAGRATLPDPSALSSPMQHMQNLQAPQQSAGFVNFMEAGKMAAVRHHLPCVTVQRHDGKVKVCPHCHQEVTERSLYRDAKGWLFHRPCFMKGKGSIKEADAPVIHERQTNDYNCGPAVLKSVENTMGVGHPNIKTYETETGANDENGTPITQLEATAAKHGLKVNSFGQMSPEQLQQATATGKPVIVAMQMDGEQGGPKGGWEAGHYVVVTGTDGQNVKFMDPSSEAPERTLPLNEFLGRWHDHDHKGKVYQQWGMTLQHPAEVKQAEDKEGATGWRKRVNVVPMPSGEGFNMVFKAGPEHPERVIGQTHLARGAYGTAYPGMIEVDPEFASRGLGAGRKFLADMARQLPGQEIHSGQVFTDAGQALWESARRKARPGVNIDKSLSFQTVKNMIRGKVSNNLKALQPYGMTMPAASAQLVDPLIAQHFPGPVKSLAQPQAQPQLKLAYSGSLGSGATSGQGTDPPRLVDASGSTPAGPENQPASDAVPCDSTHLDNCDQHPDPLVFNMADLEKMASRWSQEIASGNMSPRAMSRIMTTRPEGSFVKIKNIGHGGMNVADLGAGNVGGHAGLMVRKLPQYAPIVPGETVSNPLYKSSPAEPAPSSALARLISGAGLRQPEVPKELPKPQGLAALYGPTVEASQELDRRAPGKSLRYLGATSKGIFQEYDAGKGSIVPRQTLLGRLFGRDTEMEHMLGLRREVGAHGFQDIKPANLGPSGRIIDFTKEDSPNAMLRGMVTGGEGLEIKPETVLPKQFAKLQARRDKIYAEIANSVGQQATPIMLRSIAALNREGSELAREAYRRFHLQRAKHIPDAAPVMAQHTPRPEPTDPGLLRRGWEQAKAEVGSLKTHASDIGHAALPLAAPAALVALAAGQAYYQHQQEKKEKKKRRQEKAAIAPFEMMSVGTEETQEPSANTGAQWTGHHRDNSGSSPWKDRLREIADNYEAHQDSSSAGAGGRTQAPSGSGFQTGQSAQNSGATSAPVADGPSMQLDSDSISTGQIPHLSA